MSRTDAHAPVLVSIARGDLAAHAHHDHRNGDCDLPDRAGLAAGRHVYAWTKSSRCRWVFHYTGTNVCACNLCSSRDERRADLRKDRQTTRRALTAYRQGAEDY
jgi:hypothetical protein